MENQRKDVEECFVYLLAAGRVKLMLRKNRLLRSQKKRN